VSARAPVAAGRWAEAWPDALAFAGGLTVAWFGGWDTTDLVWSLWLSSLVVGFAMIVWGIFSPAMLHGREGSAGAAIFAALGGIGLLAFFTVHFGIFHAVHAALLNTFFPLDGSGEFPGVAIVGEAMRRYGWFLPVAALAERRGFLLPKMPPEPPRTSVKAADIAARKARQAFGAAAMFRPYVNVMRMHLLIFFFAFAHYAHWESFAVYAVVYAAYFFPWRLVLGAAVTDPDAAARARDV
jgi:hypothetical protein